MNFKYIQTMQILLAAACAVITASPAAGQAPNATSFIPVVSDAERAALMPLDRAVAAKDWQLARQLLLAAQPVARSPDALFILGKNQLQIGLAINDTRMQSIGLDHVIASGRVPTADLPIMYRNRAVLANNAGDKVKAEADFARVVELAPREPEALINLAQIKNDLKKSTEAVALIQRAIDAKKALGQPVDESWYKYALKVAYDGRNNPTLRAASGQLSRELLATYPSNDNRRDAMLIFRDTNTLDAATNLDVLRLMRSSGALAGERDWFDLADGLYRAGNYGEAKKVLDEGVNKRMIDPNKAAFAELIGLNNARLNGDLASLGGQEAEAMAGRSGALALKVGDAYYGHGNNAKAVTLYRAALAKGGIDKNLVNTHLAMALLASGNRAAAEASFRSLTGPRQTLGKFWLLWLGSSRK